MGTHSHLTLIYSKEPASLVSLYYMCCHRLCISSSNRVHSDWNVALNIMRHSNLLLIFWNFSKPTYFAYTSLVRFSLTFVGFLINLRSHSQLELLHRQR